MTNNNIQPTRSYVTALSIAGLDPSGGAGMIADVKTFSAFGVYGAAVATAITVQNTMGVSSIYGVSPDAVYGQTASVMTDLAPRAVKTGMVNDAATVRSIIRAVRQYRPEWLVVDPVMMSSSGTMLMQEEAFSVFVNELLPLASLLTPNLPEACCIAGVPFRTDMSNDETAETARIILSKGCRAVLIKGGHRTGNMKNDMLFMNSNGTTKQRTFSAETVPTRNTHGTGCTLSAAITACLACSEPLETAIHKAKQYLTKALIEGADVLNGHGVGSVNHFFAPVRMIKTDLKP